MDEERPVISLSGASHVTLRDLTVEYALGDGIRDTGYTADRGGQFRGNLVYTTDDGAPRFSCMR